LLPVPFAVGSIGPDSGIPDEKWEKFDPPSEVTHFGAEGRDDIYCADLDFFRTHLLPIREIPKVRGGNVFSFRLGYFFHLVTDNLWHQEIGMPTEEKYPDEFARDADFIWEVKRDWYGLDLIYLRDHPDSLFWKVFLDAEAETGELEFLPLEGIRQRVAYIQQYYQRTDEKVQGLYNRPYIYLSKMEMNRFVVETTTRLSRIYQCVWVDNPSTDGFQSALDLIP